MDKDNYNFEMISKVKERYKDILDSICPKEKLLNHNGKLSSEENKDILMRLMVEDSIESIDYFTYKTIFEECVIRGFKTVYDIGAATGAQSIIIEEEKLPLNYIAIEPKSPFQLHNFTTIRQTYPFKIKADNATIAISHLCIGVTETSNSKNNSAIKQLIEDFDYSILQIHNEHNSLLLNSIPNKKILDDIYFFDSSKNKTLTNNLEIKK